MLRRSLVSYSRSDFAKPQIKKHRLDSHPHVAACLWHAPTASRATHCKTKANHTTDCQKRWEHAIGMRLRFTAIFLLLPHIHMQTKKSSGGALYVSTEDINIVAYNIDYDNMWLLCIIIFFMKLISHVSSFNARTDILSILWPGGLVCLYRFGWYSNPKRTPC